MAKVDRKYLENLLDSLAADQVDGLDVDDSDDGEVVVDISEDQSAALHKRIDQILAQNDTTYEALHYLAHLGIKGVDTALEHGAAPCQGIQPVIEAAYIAGRRSMEEKCLLGV